MAKIASKGALVVFVAMVPLENPPSQERGCQSEVWISGSSAIRSEHGAERMTDGQTYPPNVWKHALAASQLASAASIFAMLASGLLV